MSELRNCPTCESPGKHLHPAMQCEGEVQPCSDPWHIPPHALTREQVEKAFLGLYQEQHIKGNIGVTTTLILLQSHIAQQAQELASVDEILSRRPALAECTTRSEKIELTINTAKRVDALAQEVERLKRENENLSAANEAHWGKQMDVSKAIAERERDIDILKANLNEMWVDEKGTVWTRPTAWAYAMVCKARDAWQGKQELAAKQVARLREFVEMVVEVSMHWPYPDISPLDENSPLMDGARLLLQDAALRETAGLGNEEKPWTRQRPTVPGHYWFRLSPNHYVMCRIERGTEGTLFAGWLTDEFRQCGVDTLPVSGEWQPVADPSE